MKLIAVEEEYGYKYWLWVITGTEEQIIDFFYEATGAEPYYAEKEPLGGEWKELTYEQYKAVIESDVWDGHAHIHTHDDSDIGFRKEWESTHQGDY